ncbi:MAG: archease [Gemmatimonadetes bacterium]|nr:archease [Gemmatimonadota bacterium]
MSPASGVTFLDHTADVGFEIAAPSKEALFHSAGVALLALLRGEEDNPAADPAAETRPHAGAAGGHAAVEVAAPDAARLLADWLRELLFLHEVERQDYQASEFATLDLSPPCRLRARVELRAGGHAVREIKGVTYHAIYLRHRGSGWEARVIFDV